LSGSLFEIANQIKTMEDGIYTMESKYKHVFSPVTTIGSIIEQLVREAPKEIERLNIATQETQGIACCPSRG
jgi:hypothetical protein